VAIAVVVTATCLPVKQLDRSVGPMNYKAMSLLQLTQLLAEDWRVFVRPDSLIATGKVTAFKTTEPMSRPQVLQKLARETGGELHIGFCGTGATFLFGAHPSFTKLRTAEPGGGSQ
jgi:hypothetical protein